MTAKRNTRSFWEGKDYDAWLRSAVPGDEDPIPWATRYFMRRLLPALSGRSVLDLGCGPGYLTPYLAAAGTSVLGVDFSANAVAAARKRCAGYENVDFVEGDILDLEFGRRFDVITGRMFLHEIMHEDTPRFIRKLDSLLEPDGFLCFYENSYFNPIARFIRRRLVGRFGIPKHGSDNELPFDRERFEMYCATFAHCERYVEGIELLQKLYHYFSPVQRDWFGNIFVAADKALTRLQARTGIFDNWSYVQTVYASHSLSRAEVFGPANRKATVEEESTR